MMCTFKFNIIKWSKSYAYWTSYIKSYWEATKVYINKTNKSHVKRKKIGLGIMCQEYQNS